MSQTRPRYLDTREEDLALLPTGQETGWWDHNGRHAPWPTDFWLVAATINPRWALDAQHSKEVTHTD